MDSKNVTIKINDNLIFLVYIAYIYIHSHIYMYIFVNVYSLATSERKS